ncbi:MAG: DUF1707 SHOCT-like domain-containing protein [Solirubrobacteraceae bacterium]
MLLSDSDRELLFEKLNRHAAQGTLALDELERRVEKIVAAQTREDAAAVMADLPALPGEPSPARARWRRGHGDADAPGVDWRPTGERFRDPRTNRVMRVWEDAAGARHYVADDQQ